MSNISRTKSNEKVDHHKFCLVLTLKWPWFTLKMHFEQHAHASTHSRGACSWREWIEHFCIAISLLFPLNFHLPSWMIDLSSPSNFFFFITRNCFDFVNSNPFMFIFNRCSTFLSPFWHVFDFFCMSCSCLSLNYKL